MLNDPTQYREEMRENGRKKYDKRKRSDDSDNLKDSKSNLTRKSQKTRYDQLISSGFIDMRIQEKKCSRCTKLCVKSEEFTVDTILKDNETLCVYKIDKRVNRIYWQYFCIICKNENERNSHINGTGKFDSNQVGNLRRHLTMTSKEMRIALNQLREQFGGKCAACGIQTIPKGKSGFRQQSLTDMYPKNRPDDDKSCSVDDMRLVCLACQYHQHDLNWNEFFDTFREIQQALHKPKNLTPLNQEELEYFLNSGDHSFGKNIDLRRKLFARDGRNCQYTGVEMRFEPGYWNSVSFDRFDSSQKYTLENTHLVCKTINYIKKQAITEQELKDWIAHVRSPNFVFQYDKRQ
jgi:hypothetical protein